LYPESAHVVEVDLLGSPDREIWEFAKSGNFVSVSTESDFYELAATLGPPPKVVWLRR
jgi:predicted nuclease of predicted toxin-antitoxin system